MPPLRQAGALCDNASRLGSLTNGFSVTTAFTRDAAGRITRQDHANGTYALATYPTGSTGRGWLTAVEHKKSNNTTLARYEYTRGLTGHITNASQPGDHAEGGRPCSALLRRRLRVREAGAGAAAAWREEGWGEALADHGRHSVNVRRA